MFVCFMQRYNCYQSYGKYLIWVTPLQFWEEPGVISMTSKIKETQSLMARSYPRQLEKTFPL